MSKVCRKKPKKAWLRNSGSLLGKDGYLMPPPNRPDIAAFQLSARLAMKRGIELP